MERWKLNLTVLWAGQFLVMGGMTMITPFISFYLQEMGVPSAHVGFWAGIIFAANFLTSFIFQPIWGGLADRYGRKIMLLRSGFGMALTMTAMGFATSPWHLLILRLLNGTISGFNPAAVSLVSANTPKEKVGYAMGLLQTGNVAGTILGPLIGGLLAEVIGFRYIFYLTGSLLFIASLLATFVVKEDFNAAEMKAMPKVGFFSGFGQLMKIPQIPALFSVTFLIQYALMSPSQLMPIFVQDLYGNGAFVVFIAGLVGSINGISNLIASPILGKLGDKHGSEKILSICLVGTAVCFIPQAFVSNVWQLLPARFALGMFMGGLLPSVYALIRKFTPEGMESRCYGFNTSTMSLGNMLGPLTGGLIAGWITIRGLFLISAFLLLFNAIWVRYTLIKGKRPHFRHREGH